MIYAPTWSAQSSLNAAGERIIAALAGMPLNVIVKLHVCSYIPRGSGGVDWRERLHPWSARPNVRVVSDPDASPYLVASDLLVTDHSTVGFEFMLLDRPVIVVHQPALIDSAAINPEKVELLHSATHVVHDVADLPTVVGEELRRPDRLSDNRRAIAEALFYRCGTATDRVMTVVYELLDLAPHGGPRTRSPGRDTTVTV